METSSKFLAESEWATGRLIGKSLSVSELGTGQRPHSARGMGRRARWGRAIEVTRTMHTDTLQAGSLHWQLSSLLQRWRVYVSGNVTSIGVRKQIMGLCRRTKKRELFPIPTFMTLESLSETSELSSVWRALTATILPFPPGRLSGRQAFKSLCQSGVST